MIVVTGATGTVGRELVGELLRRECEVRAMTRSPADAGLPAGAQIVSGSPSDRQALRSALDGADAVFLNVFGDAEPVAECLSESSVRRVVLLSSQSAGSRPDLPYARHFRDLEHRLREVRDDLVVLRPGQFMSNNLWWAPMIGGGHVTAPFADVAIPTIDPADIAAVAAETLVDDRHVGATYLLTGSDAPTPRQRAETIAEVLGQTITFDEQTEQQFRDANSALPAEALNYMIEMTGRPADEDRRTTSTVEELTGRRPASFRDWVERHRHELMPAAG